MSYLKNKIKTNTLATNIWLALIIFSILILGFLWIFQVIFFNSYYKNHKIHALNKAASELKTNYQKNNPSIVESIAQKHNVCIEIYNNKTSAYAATYFNQGCMEFGNKNFKVKNDFINSNLNQKQYNLINTKFNNDTLIYAIKLNKNSYAFINASLIPMDGAIEILRSQMIYITLIILILSFIIGYFISKSISKPITKINNNAKKLAEGNYNVTFSSESNIYEINELAATLNYTKEELSKTEELKRDLLANVSHDLKTPLTMIKAYAEMVRDLSYKDQEKRENHLNTIIKETDRLNLLVNDILDLSAIQAGGSKLNKEKFDLSEMIKEIINRFNILSQKEGYKFIFDYNTCIVYADKKRIYQVIYNLINNAINYTGKDKTVTIIIKEKKETYLVEIKDSGDGIKKEDIDHIWDKYYHNSKKHKRNEYGTGLGLSIVKNILQSHNCPYGVKSSEKGTTFYFEINKNI